MTGWTRAHQRAWMAYFDLAAAHYRRGMGVRGATEWLSAQGLPALPKLTTAQARMVRRRWNAWRASMEGRPTVKPARPRKKR